MIIETMRGKCLQAAMKRPAAVFLERQKNFFHNNVKQIARQSTNGKFFKKMFTQTIDGQKYYCLFRATTKSRKSAMIRSVNVLCLCKTTNSVSDYTAIIYYNPQVDNPTETYEWTTIVTKHLLDRYYERVLHEEPTDFDTMALRFYQDTIDNSYAFQFDDQIFRRKKNGNLTKYALSTDGNIYILDDSSDDRTKIFTTLITRDMLFNNQVENVDDDTLDYLKRVSYEHAEQAFSEFDTFDKYKSNFHF